MNELAVNKCSQAENEDIDLLLENIISVRNYKKSPYGIEAIIFGLLKDTRDIDEIMDAVSDHNMNACFEIASIVTDDSISEKYPEKLPSEILFEVAESIYQEYTDYDSDETAMMVLQVLHQNKVAVYDSTESPQEIEVYNNCQNTLIIDFSERRKCRFYACCFDAEETITIGFENCKERMCLLE